MKNCLLLTIFNSSILGGSLTREPNMGTVISSIGIDQIIRELIDRRRLFCWKQVVPSIPGGDLRRLPTLN